MAEEQTGRAVALGPLRWNLRKIEQRCDERVNVLEREAAEKKSSIECTQRKERRALTQRLRRSREAAKAAIPLSGRLATLKASRDNLMRLGRLEEAQKVQRKLDPLEKSFWAKALAGTGFAQEAKREKSKLLSAQQAELGSLNLVLRRDITQAQQAKNAEVKAQQRKNPCSSDDVWSIWSAAKSGEAKRLAHMLSLPRANVDARDPDSGWTALQFASRQGKLAAVRVLLENQAFVGERAPDGRTPLHFAAGWGTFEVCFALLQAGADKTLRDNNGETSQDLAESRDRDKIYRLLNDWRPLGLTATQTQKIKESRGEGPMRPWETEADPEIKSQLRVLDMKRMTFGERHAGTHTTLGRLGGLCRAAGRLEDAKNHLGMLVELLQATPAESGGRRSSSRKGGIKPSAPARGEPGAQAVSLGNLGVVCHEMGDAEQASRFLEASLQTALSIADSSLGGDASHKLLVDAATRNLGMHYLSEGRVHEARPLLRTVLEGLEEALRSDMAGGHESLDLIPALTVLSYADMLAGEHAAAAENAERAQSIAAKHHQYGDELRDLLPAATAAKTRDLSDPRLRLEWMGVQRFAAGDTSSACDFFVRARELVLRRRRRRLHDESCSTQKGACAGTNGHASGLRSTKAGADRREPALTNGLANRGARFMPDKELRKDGKAAAGDDAEVVAREFHPDAMRLDRCIAVSICRGGPEAF